MTNQLRRSLGTRDAVAVGLGSMIGAGVFVVWAPAAAAAGSWLLLGLCLAAVVAVCNAWSSAALAVRYPEAGGTYVYGRERLGPWAGYLAGWSFVVGKLASCAVMAMAIAAHAAPGHERLAAAVAVVVVTALNLTGVQRSATVSRVIVLTVLAVVAGVLVAVLTSGEWAIASLDGPAPVGVYGVLQSAGLIFLAFAGYARIATLAEEVADPVRTIPRAVALSVGTVLLVYVLVALLTLGVLGPDRLAMVTDPVAAATAAALGETWAVPVRVAAVAAALGALLNLVLGISRTGLAMARDGHLPRALSTVSPSGVPRFAEVVVGAVVLLLVLAVDLRGALGFSSFGVLTYYAIANASAWTLEDWSRRRVVPAVGLLGCLVLVVTLPWESVMTGIVVIGVGMLWFSMGKAVATVRSRAGHSDP